MWKCFDCQIDENAIQCNDCFANANHEGHHVLYISSGGGCCDCGDVDNFSINGSCSKHRGFEASRAAMLSALPPYVQANGQRVFSALIKSLKRLLLAF